jgi:hypothetical protein
VGDFFLPGPRALAIVDGTKITKHI